MAWTWLTNVTDDTYWAATSSNWDYPLLWTGSSWSTADRIGLSYAYLSPFSEVYGYYGYEDASPLYGATIRAVKVYYTLTNPPNDHSFSASVLTTLGYETETVYFDESASGIYEASWDASPGEGISRLRFGEFGDYYEPGLITRIDVEIWDDDPEPAVAAWTGYIRCREIVV